MAKTKDALRILAKDTGESESIRSGIARAKINFEVAQMIYDARTKAGLSQSELAALIESKQPVISGWRTLTTIGIRWRCRGESRARYGNVWRFDLFRASP